MKKPPLGIEPHKFWVETRINDIINAMDRYIQSDCTIPIEWVNEYNTLTKELNSLKNGI